MTNRIVYTSQSKRIGRAFHSRDQALKRQGRGHSIAPQETSATHRVPNGLAVAETTTLTTLRVGLPKRLPCSGTTTG